MQCFGVRMGTEAVTAVLFFLLTLQCLNASSLSSMSSYEFTGYRMQHYLLQQDKHGTGTYMVVTQAHTDLHIVEKKGSRGETIHQPSYQCQEQLSDVC